jgi:hypothetical protein
MWRGWESSNGIVVLRYELKHISAGKQPTCGRELHPRGKCHQRHTSNTVQITRVEATRSDGRTRACGKDAQRESISAYIATKLAYFGSPHRPSISMRASEIWLDWVERKSTR